MALHKYGVYALLQVFFCIFYWGEDGDVRGHGVKVGFLMS